MRKKLEDSMASTLPYISREELDELENELRTTKDGYAPDIDALQRTILLDLIAAFRGGTLPTEKPTPYVPAQRLDVVMGEELARQCRIAALEEAAKECETPAYAHRPIPGTNLFVGKELAVRIRALKDKP